MKNLTRVVPFLLGALLVPTIMLAAEEFQNPVQFPSIAKFIEGTLRAIVYVSMPIIALFIVYAGFKYIIARGNPGKIGEAHTNFLYVVIGAMLILGAWVLATLIAGTVSQLMAAP